MNSRLDIAEWMRWQALAEPFYGALLNTLADEVEAGRPASRPIELIADLPRDANHSLRLMGAAHRLALAGEAPDYAAHLPSCGGDGDASAAWPALRELCAGGALDAGVLAPVQTNEPARTTTLLPAFSLVARETGLPLRLLELGASAGLLLNIDRYHHQLDDATWGDEASPLHLRCAGSAPLAPFAIVGRRGCDPNPLDPQRDRLVLLSFVWPTQLDRFRVLDAALDIAADHPVTVDRSGAGAWLGGQLADAAPGAATVIYHSVVWQYIGATEQEDITKTITAAGSCASEEAPLAWVRLEPHERPELGTALVVTLWPGGRSQSLALCSYHGTFIKWGPRDV